MHIGNIKKRVEDSLNTTISDSPSTHPYNRTLSYLPYKSKIVRTTTTLNELRSTTKQSAQNREVFLLQIEQLRQENKLLKKKIQEMAISESQEPYRIKIVTQKEKDELQKKSESLASTMSSLMEELCSLLKSIGQQFAADFEGLELKRLNETIYSRDEIYPAKKFAILATNQLQKSLQKVMAASQHDRFQKLIDLFANYFTAKEESDKWLVISINKIKTQVNHFNNALTIKKSISQAKKENEGLDFQSGHFELGEKQMPITTRTHQRNKSSITTTDSHSGFKYFRRTNKPL